MKVYFAGIGNSDYIQSLMDSLRKVNVEVIDGHNHFINRRIPKGEIIHIHWPEAYFNDWYANDHKVLSRYQSAIQFYKGRNLIYFTVHNLLPHNGNSEIRHALYEVTINSSNLLIHLGPYSIKPVNEKYQTAESIEQIIVPHHILPTPTNIPNKYKARSQLGLPKNKYIVASIGRLRNMTDVSLMWDYYDKLNESKECHLYLHKYERLVNRFIIQNTFKYPYLTYKELWHRFFKKDVTTSNIQISLYKLSAYISASDLVILPRAVNINSGVPYVVCNFKKPILTSNEGNIKWGLEKLGYSINEQNIFTMHNLQTENYNKQILKSLINIYSINSY